MNANDLTPHSVPVPRAGAPLGGPHDTVVTARRLRDLGLTPARIAERCRPGGPWQQVLPQVYLLHSGPPSSEERVWAALLYAGRSPEAHGEFGDGREAMLTGLAALALHRLSGVPPLIGLPRIDVLVPRQRRLRDAGEVVVRRARALPLPQDVGGLPCAPVPRALADAVAQFDDPDTVRALFAEAVRGGHCEAAAVLRELAEARLLDRAPVRRALDVLRAEDRRTAEQRLYALVGCHHLPDPVWNVELRLPGGPPLGAVDAYWPEHGVAAVLDQGDPDDPGASAAGAASGGPDDTAPWSSHARQREHLEALGIRVIAFSPATLRQAAERQATVIRTALLASADLDPAAYVVITPR